VPTEAEARSRMLLVQAAASRAARPTTDLFFSEFAVFDEEEGDGDGPFSGVIGPGSQLPPAPLMPSGMAPQTAAPQPEPPPVATGAAAATAPPPPPSSAPPQVQPSDAQPPAVEPFLPPLVMVPELEEPAPAAPIPPGTPVDVAPTLELPPELLEPPRPGADNQPAVSEPVQAPPQPPSPPYQELQVQPAPVGDSFWADPVAPPVQRSVPPVKRAPVMPTPVVPSSTLTGRAASVVARQKAVKPVPGGWLLVPRRTIFLQGGLIVIVGLICFVAGWLVARGSSGKSAGEQPTEAAAMESVLVQGTVTYRTPEGRIEGDEGAVILVWPKDAVAQPRIDPTELHPSQAAPHEGSRAMLGLEEIGAKHVRALNDGTYNLVVPRRGEYYVLFVSRRTLRSADESVDERTMNVLRRVFAPAATGIDRQKYHLRIENFDSGLEVCSHDFDRSGT